MDKAHVSPTVVPAHTRGGESLLKVQGLKMHFPITKGFFNRTVGAVKAVDGVSFEIKEVRCLLYSDVKALEGRVPTEPAVRR